MEMNSSPSDEKLKSYYEECFENDLNEDESEEDEEDDDSLLLIIKQKKEELNEMNSKKDMNIQIEGWNDLLNAIILQEKEYSYDLTAEFNLKNDEEKRSSNEVQKSQMSSRSENVLRVEDLEKAIIQELEISDEVRDVVFGMIDSVEYIASLEFEKDFSSKALEAVSIEKPISILKEFDENSFESSNFQNPPPAPIETKNMSDELMKSETKYQETLQSAIDEMEREMKEREEELRKAVEMEKQEREERKQRVKKQLERLHRESRFATRIQSQIRRYLVRKSYLLMKLDIKQRIENRREKDERAQMQREEHYCLELERQRKMILEEERRRAEALLAFENQRMLTEETEMRKFLENEKKEAIRRQQEQEERERKEKELLAKRLREEQEKAEAEAKALAERQRKEREQEQMRRENEIREEQLKLEQVQREKKEKELKDRERQQKKEKEKIKATTKDRIVTGSLTARKSGVSGWGGAIEEPTMSSLEEESKNPLNEVINQQDSLSTDAAISDKSSPTSGNSAIVNPPMKDISSSSTDSDTVGPIVSLPLCDDTSVLNRITSFVQLGITSAKEPMKYQSSPTDGSPSDSNQLQEDLSSLQSIDSILKNSLVTWKHWKQHHLMTPSSQTLPPPHHDTPRAHSHRQSHQQQPQQSQQQQTPHLSATTELKMSVENLQNLQFLKDYPSLISLECNVNQLTSLSDMSQYSCSTSLTDLSLNDNQLTSLHGLESYHSLQSLHCDVNQLIDLSPLQHLSHLLTLSIKMNRLETFPSLHLPSLQKLDLYHNRITSLTSSLTSSTSLQSLPSLTHLDLGRNKLTTLDGHLLSHCQLLSHLILSQNQLSHLPTPLYLPNLRSLWLSKNSICSLDSWIGHGPLPTPSHTLSSPSSSSSSSSPSSSSPWPVFLPLLEKLYLQDNEIKTIPKYSFVTSPLLNELDLSFNNLSEVTSTDGILCCCPQLKRLQLQENPLLSRPNQQTLIIITRIQNTLPHLKEFCGHPVDAKKGVYAPPPPALVSSIALPLTTTEIAKEKQLRTKQRCEVIRNLKRNCWKGNVSEIFRFPSSLHTSPATSSAVASSSASVSASSVSASAGVDLLDLEPIQSHHPCSCVSPDYQRWSHFLSSLVAEQNIFKIREKLSSSSSSHPPHQLLGISSFVELLRSHCQLIHNWQQQQQQDLFTSFPPRVVFVSPSFPLSLSLPVPISATAMASVSVSRKENTKEYHAVIRARQTHAVLAIQSLWRGHFTRKRLTHLLSHAKYYDADLEHLMDAHNLTDYLGILTEALPELSDDWLSHKQLGHSSNHTSANDNGGDSNTATLVYGDHRRKKMNYSPRSESSSFHPHPHHTPITPPERSPRAHRPTPRNPSEAAGGRGRGSHGEWVVDEKKTEILEESGVYLHRRTSVSRNANPKIHSHLRGEEEWDRDSEELGHQLFPSLNTHPRPSSSASASASSEISRPASSSSTISGYRDHSSTPHSATSTSSQRFGKGEYHGDNEDIEMLLHTGRTRVSTTSSSFSATGAGAGAPDHWGVSSRPAVHNVLKRSKLSNAQAAQAKEEEKDPALRYEKYSKIIAANMGSSSLNVTKGNTKTSGSFGGKPKMVRSTQQKKHTPPAWLTGHNDGDGGEK